MFIVLCHNLEWNYPVLYNENHLLYSINFCGNCLSVLCHDLFSTKFLENLSVCSHHVTSTHFRVNLHSIVAECQVWLNG